VKATLLSLPASHPTVAARLMLERKGVEVRQVDLLPALHKLLLRAMGFPGVTVPAVFLDGQRLQGSRTISRALDALVPEPRLFPSEAGPRETVERAELWGDLVLQSAARRLAWAALMRDRSTLGTFLEDAHLGVPDDLAVATAPPFVWLAARLNRAGDRSARRDLAALPRMLDRVDRLIADGVIGGERPNAADYQLATSVRLLMTLDDLRPAIKARPAGRLAAEIVPRFPGRVPPVFPAEWLRRVGALQ
jgi:glutathione S-transferase